MSAGELCHGFARQIILPAVNTQPPTRVLLAWSGGKDSSIALQALRADPTLDVIGLLTAVTADYDRVSMHGVRREILHAQAQSIGLPLIEATLRAGDGNDDYDAAWGRGLRAARETLGSFEVVSYGDLFLEDVRQYREDQARRLGYTPFFPLWGRATADVARAFVDDGFEAYLCCVDCTQAPAEFSGRRFDHQLLAAMPSSIDPCGERGEFHTCVVDGPIFSKRILVDVGDRVRRDERFEYCELTLAA